LLVPVSLNIVCFRYAALHLNESQLQALNAEILLRLQERGIAVLSSTILSGNRFALRVANTNQRSLSEDFEVLVRAVLEEGRKLATEITYHQAPRSSADAMQGWNLTDPGVNRGFSKPQSEVA
jgi:aromatic-L-amino-acid/L-tryptophan decarboxylase